MISSSENFKKAAVADIRKSAISILVDIIDPNIVYKAADYQSLSSYSNLPGLYDKDFSEPKKFATLEKDRWILDGSFDLYEDTKKSEIYISENLCDENGNFSPSEYATINFENVSVLQSCSVYFPDNDYDGYPLDFKVEILQNENVYFSKEYTSNSEKVIKIEGFTVPNPDAIKVSVSKWSIGKRRLRIVEIVPGIYEKWDANKISDLSIKHQGDPSCISLPYGTCSLTIDNSDKRFEARNKNSVFKSIEDRQKVSVSIGFELQDKSVELKECGPFFQYSGGWKTSDNGMTISWDLVDIIGLLQEKNFYIPEILPTYLDGWISLIVSHLGNNFSDMYEVHSSYIYESVLCRSKEDLKDLSCGDILRYVCMVTGTFPRRKNGKLYVGPIEENGNKITLDNIIEYPEISANEDVSSISFKIFDGSEEENTYTLSGNSTASNNDLDIKNPFVTSESIAIKTAKNIIKYYGGFVCNVNGRGDPSSEIGDIDALWIDESSSISGIRTEQDFSFNNGVLSKCKSVLMQPNGYNLYFSVYVFSTSTTWTVPENCTNVKFLLIGKGENGINGLNGDWDSDGENGADGSGGKIYIGSMDVLPGQNFEIEISENTSFGEFSSKDGVVYENGYADIYTGVCYARTGVENPLPGSGDGGKGGEGGLKGEKHTEDGNEIIDMYPTNGKNGSSGAYGSVIIYIEN